VTEAEIRKAKSALAAARLLLADGFAEGRDTGIVDLVLLGDLDPVNLADLTGKAEKHLNRKIRTLVYDHSDVDAFNALIQSSSELASLGKQCTNGFEKPVRHCHRMTTCIPQAFDVVHIVRR